MTLDSVTSLDTSSTMGSIPAVQIVAPYATTADCSHILVILELKHLNIHKWMPFFKSSLARLLEPTLTSRWVMDDACIHSWLLGSITTDDLAIDGEQSALALVTIEGLFLSNKEPHTVFMHEISMSQGASPLTISANA